MPRISVVMPTYNAQKYLKEAIDSILNQTFSDFELLIIDDNSTDNTRNIINSFNDDRIKLIDGDNKGIAAALNKGLELAKGEFIARMDADDVSYLNRFEEQIKFMETHPEAGIICSLAKYIIDDEIKEEYFVGGFVKNKKGDFELGIIDFLNTCPMCHPTCFFRKSYFDKFNLRYNENYRESEDQELWSRAVLCFKIFYQNIPLLYYRIHDNNAARSSKTIKRGLTQGHKLALGARIKLLKKIQPQFNLDLDKITYKEFEKRTYMLNNAIAAIALFSDKTCFITKYFDLYVIQHGLRYYIVIKLFGIKLKIKTKLKEK